MLVFMPFIRAESDSCEIPFTSQNDFHREPNETHVLHDIIYLLNATYRCEKIFISWIFEKVVYSYVSFDDSSEHTFVALICREN